MREIKFRAYDRNLQGWIAEWVNFAEGKAFVLRGNHMVELTDADVVQFTGLKDKNGKEIYEGDVVKHREREVGNLEVKFWNGGWIGEANDTAAQPLFDEDWWRKSKGADKITNIEVVGNIYENPELLK